MKLSRSERLTEPFVLHWDDLEKFVQSVSAILPNISLVAACADRMDRSFADLEELRTFGNPERCAITELVVVARDEKFDERCSLTLSTDESRNVRISIEGGEQNAVRLNDLLNDFIDSVKPWYAWIARTDWHLVVMGLWFITCVGIVLFALARADVITFTSSSQTNIPTRPILKGIFIGSLPFIAGMTLNSVRRKFFPTGDFAIGDGKKRHRRIDIVRNGIIVAFAISVVSSVVVAWFQ